MVYREFKIPADTNNSKPSEDEEGGSAAQSSTTSSFWGTAATVGAIAGTALLAWSMKGLLSSAPGPSQPWPGNSEKDKKKKIMKCPGRPGEKMARDDFDAKSYFRGLHTEERAVKAVKKLLQ